MDRPPIEKWLYEDRETSLFVAISKLCRVGEYALALERKVAAVRKAVDKDRLLCTLCVKMKADIEQALKEEP